MITTSSHKLISQVLTLRQNRVNLSIELSRSSHHHTTKTTTIITKNTKSSSSKHEQKKVTFEHKQKFDDFPNPNSTNMHSNPIYGTNTDDDIEYASIQTLELFILHRFQELRQFALFQLGQLDAPPVQLTMLESVYMLKMGSLRYDTDLELAKFDHYSSNCFKQQETKRYQRLKVS